MALLRAVVTIPHISALAEDAVSNSFYFATPPTGPEPAGLENIRVDLNRFYNDPGEGEYPAKHLSPSLKGSDARLKVYNLGDPKPRPPILDVSLALATVGGSPLPSEVAICLSFQAVKIAGTPQARRRGRIYLGPIRTAAVAPGNVARVHGSAMGGIRSSAKKLILESNGAGHYPWVVQSGLDVDGQAPTALVDNGWVDDAFDTIRRRGEKATLRLTFDSLP